MSELYRLDSGYLFGLLGVRIVRTNAAGKKEVLCWTLTLERARKVLDSVNNEIMRRRFIVFHNGEVLK